MRRNAIFAICVICPIGFLLIAMLPSTERWFSSGTADLQESSWNMQASPTPIVTVDERISRIEEELRDLAQEIDTTGKDNWDKLSAASAASEVVVALLIAAIGGIAAWIYRERQQKLLNIQAVQGFMEYLQKGDERAVQAALLAITELGNSKIAAGFAEYYGTNGAIAAMARIASTQIGDKASQAQIALNKAVVDFKPMLQSLVEIWDDNRLKGLGLLVGADGDIVTTDYITDTIDSSKRKVLAGELQFKIAKQEVEQLDYGLARIRIEDTKSLRPFTHWKSVANESIVKGQAVYILGVQPRAGIVPITGEIVETERAFMGLQNMIVLSIQSFRFTREFYSGAIVLGLDHKLIGIVVHTNTSIQHNSFEEVTVLRKEHIFEAIFNPVNNVAFS